jgi:radical SAM superfamily enzyme YgiQ (UPF0313 family)
MEKKMMKVVESNENQVRILLMTLPFLTPLIPPMGISCLKSYLQREGFAVKTVDVMAEMEIREWCYRYFDTLEKYVPEKKRGFYFNIALDVLFNHMMAHINHTDKEKYEILVKQLVERNFFIHLEDNQVMELNRIIETYFQLLESFILQLIEKEKPTILGLSVYKGTLASSLFSAAVVKEKNPRIKIVMGGTIFSQDLFPDTPNFHRFRERATYIDKIFIGESEQLFLKYLRGELDDKQTIFTLKDINEELLDLNTVDLPDYTDFDLTAYPLLPSFTSRGCVYRCSFCAETVYWKRYNRKKVTKVVDEFEQLSKKYQRNLFVLTDCLVNPLVTPLAEEVIARDLNVYWDVYIKVDKNVCDPERTHLWRRGGYYRARLGIESGSPHVLDMIDKRITVDEIRAALKSLAAAGIKTTTYWISGHPGETEKDFRQTLDLLEELQDYIYEAECDPFRYFFTGQVKADVWAKEKGNSLLYPEEATDMLLTQTWTLNEDPSREIIYERGARFREHCKKLGIPNPYSVSELIEADKRWLDMQRNAVPPVLELNGNWEKYAGEQKNIKMIMAGQNTLAEEVDFSF